MSPKAEQLRAALQSLQMHAMGMHAAADLALRILAEMRGPQSALEKLAERQRQGPMHYSKGPPAEEAIDALFDEAERSGGIAPSAAATAADHPSEQEH